jgi:hypothetical protein
MPRTGARAGWRKDQVVSVSTVHRIWRAFSLQPHRTETFKLSADPQFVEKVRDIVGLYLDPPEKALVVCADEKSQIQALDRTQPLLPLLRGNGGRPPCWLLSLELAVRYAYVSVHSTYRKVRHSRPDDLDGQQPQVLQPEECGEEKCHEPNKK